MCFNKAQPVDNHSTQIPTIVQFEQYQINESDNSRTFCEENDIIEFGPIKVKPRKKPAPTLATGRRSKYEKLTPEEEKKRDIRRARNRAAAERVRVNRLNVEQQLTDHILALEEQESRLLRNIETLQHTKLNLETRLLTHERICGNMNTANWQVPSQTYLTNNAKLENNTFSSQLVDSSADMKMNSMDLELLDSRLIEELLEDNAELMPTEILDDDLNFLLEP